MRHRGLPRLYLKSLSFKVFSGELGGMPLVVQFVPKTLCLSNTASLVSVALAKNNESAVGAGTKQDSEKLDKYINKKKKKKKRGCQSFL